MDGDPFTAPLTITQCVTLKLNDSNYLSWKFQFEQFLNSQSLLGYVTGATPRPSPTVSVTNGEIVTETANPAYAKWVQTDQRIMAWLCGSLSEEAIKSVYGLRSSQELWYYLAQKYNRISPTRKLELQSRVQNTKKGARSLAEYLSEMKLLCDQLDSIGAPLSDQEKIYGVLRGLGREYESISTVIESSMDTFPGPNFDDVVFKLIGFNDKLSTYESSTEVSLHQAFYSNNRGGYSSRGRGNRGGTHGGGGYSTQGRGFHQQISHGSGRGGGSSEDRPTCQICNKFGHPAYKCFKRFDHSFQTEEYHRALAAFRSKQQQTTGQEWCADSGATAHITNQTSHLQSAQAYSGGDTVLVGNGEYLPITHVGTAVLPSLQGKLLLNDVLVCPNITKSLLSVSKLTADYPCCIEFDSDSVVVKDKQTRQLLTKGSRQKDLYVLENPRFMTFYSHRQQVTSDDVWHKRLGHPHQDVLQRLAANKAISINKSSSQLCEACQLGKSSRLPFSASEFVATKPLERVHCDLWGPSPVVSTQGFRFYAVFVDHYSRYSWLYPLKLKSDFFSVFLSFQKYVEHQLDCKIKSLQTDGGGEFTSTQLKQHLVSCGIKHQLSCPHTPQQNGVAERKHRHVTELGLALMFQSKVPHQLWVEAFLTAAYLSNLLPSSVLPDHVSPYEMLVGKPPVYTSLRVFGCSCYPFLKPYAENKFDPKSLHCVFLGYSEQHKGYRCLHPPSARVYVSRHVLFNEASFPYQKDYQSFLQLSDTKLLSAWKSEFAVEPTPLPIPQPEEDFIPFVPQPPTPPNPAPPLFIPEDFPPLPSPAVSQPQAPAPTHPMTTRGKCGIRKPNPHYVLMSVKTNYPEPKSVSAALKDPLWTAAMGHEKHNMELTHTWDLVPPSQDVQPVSCGWVYKSQFNADGTLKKRRARLVARGNEQEEGIDYVETYSRVVRTATIRSVLHIATVKGWSIKQLDVENAFLHGDLKETVYMKQPPGFIDPERPNHLCKLRKAIYGLRQSPRAWFDKFSTFLLEFGFKCTHGDPSLFVYIHGSDVIYLLLYVDDMLLTSNNDKLIGKLMVTLQSTFRMKDMGSVHYFLGIEVRAHDEGLFLCQEKYTKDLLEIAGMAGCDPMPTPLPLQLDRVVGHDELFLEPTYFRSLAGKLQYLTLTRPDIQFAVNYVCQKMHAPTKADFTNLKRILRYLKGTSSLGLNINAETGFLLYGFSDSDWAGCRETRRSTGGMCTFLGSNIISWSAKRHPTVSRSSTEAEYRTLSITATELKWLASLLGEMGISLPDPPKLFCDNLSAVYLTANPALHNRSKHFDTDFHYVRERVALGALVVS